MKKHITVFICMVMILFKVSAQDTVKTNDPWKNTRSGNGLYKNKNFKAAEQKYRDAAKTDSSKVVSSYNLGNSLYEQGKYDEAEKAYKNSLGSKNKDTLNRANFNLGNSQFEQGKYEEAEQSYKEALKNNPNDEAARHNLAMAQHMIKVKKEGLKDTMMSVKKDPNGKYLKKDSNGKKQQVGPNDPKNGKKDPNGTPTKPLDPKKQSMSADEAKKVMAALRDSEQKTRERMNQNGSESSYKPSRDKDW